MRNRYAYHSAHGKGACSSLTEFAERVGVDQRVLGKLLAADPKGPKPKINGRSAGHSTHSIWYCRAELARWWKTRPEGRDHLACASGDR